MICVLAVLLAQEPAAKEPAPQEPAKPAEPGYHAGDFSFYPSARTRIMFDNNIFLESPKDENSDIIILPTASIGTVLDTEHFQARLDYDYTHWYHLDHVRANRDEQDAGVRFAWDPGAFFMNFGGSFNKSAQPIDAAFSNLVIVKVWSGDISLGYDIDDAWRVVLDTNYSNLGTQLKALEFFENDTWSFTPKVFHKFSEEVAGTFELTYGNNHYFHGDVAPVKEDSNIYRGRVGAVWSVSEEVNLSGLIGYERRDYEGGNTPAFAAFDHDFEGIVYEGSVSWKPDPSHRVTGRIYRDVRESVLSNFMSTYGASLAYSYVIEPGWDVAFFGTGERGKESVSEGVAEAWKWKYSGRVTMLYTIYQGMTDDFVLAAGTLTGEASLEYRSKKTNDDTSEYENWRGTLGVKYDF